MNLEDYLTKQSGHDWGELLTEWHWRLPADFTLWLVNRYGDLFLVLEDDSVHMLDTSGGTLECVADCRDVFSTKIDQGDNANQWLMIPLVDDCVGAGLVPGPGQCYSFKQSLVLGGEYSISNTEVCDLSIHYSIHGQIHRQIKDVPDGTNVNIRVDDA